LGLFGRTRRNTLGRSLSNVHHHYDIGNDFYRLWLDEQMLYTCAYFASPEMTLEEAQIAKMDHVCRKVWLRPGEEVVELGCGWGGLALHMAREYGVRVRAYNVSQEQVRYARERAPEQGLDGQVEFIQADWRTAEGPCDAVMSVGMLEHVGRANYELLGQTVSRILRPHGRGLIHSIGRNYPRPFDRWIERRIFPGAYPPAIREFMEIFESPGLSVLDVENIRLHYAETCRQWLERFESNVSQVREMFDEKFVRTWRMYLASSSAAFLAGGLQLFQVVFAPGGSNLVPRNREYIYGAEVERFGADGRAGDAAAHRANHAGHGHSSHGQTGHGHSSHSQSGNGQSGNGETPKRPR
jgi:cyclopropane-fatty-acyl-phospholipid synthase